MITADCHDIFSHGIRWNQDGATQQTQQQQQQQQQQQTLQSTVAQVQSSPGGMSLTDVLILVLTSGDESVLATCIQTCRGQVQNQLPPKAAVAASSSAGQTSAKTDKDSASHDDDADNRRSWQAPWSYQIVVMCNSTDPKYEQRLRNLYAESKDIRLVFSASNGTPGRGHNACLTYFHSVRHLYRYMLLVDGDDFLYPCALQELRKCVRSQSDLDVLFLQCNDSLKIHDFPEDVIVQNQSVLVSNNIALRLFNPGHNESFHRSMRQLYYNPFRNGLHTPGSGTPGRAVLWCSRLFDKLRFWPQLNAFEVPVQPPRAGTVRQEAPVTVTIEPQHRSAFQPKDTITLYSSAPTCERTTTATPVFRQLFDESCKVHDDLYTFCLLWQLRRQGTLRVVFTSNMHVWLYNGFNGMSVTNSNTDTRYVWDTMVAHAWVDPKTPNALCLDSDIVERWPLEEIDVVQQEPSATPFPEIAQQKVTFATDVVRDLMHRYLVRMAALESVIAACTDADQRRVLIFDAQKSEGRTVEMLRRCGRPVRLGERFEKLQTQAAVSDLATAPVASVAPPAQSDASQASQASQAQQAQPFAFPFFPMMMMPNATDTAGAATAGNYL